MGIRLINIFGTLYNPLDIRSVSCPEKIETNYDHFDELMKLGNPEPGNWILPERMEAMFYVTFTSHKAGDKPLEIKVVEPFPEVLVNALKKARATPLKKDWRGRVNRYQVDDLRRMVQASVGIGTMDIIHTYGRLRLAAANECTKVRLDWMFAMEEIPIYRYPPDAQFKVVPMDASAA